MMRSVRAVKAVEVAVTAVAVAVAVVVSLLFDLVLWSILFVTAMELQSNPPTSTYCL